MSHRGDIVEVSLGRCGFGDVVLGLVLAGGGDAVLWHFVGRHSRGVGSCAQNEQAIGRAAEEVGLDIVNTQSTFDEASGAGSH